MDADGRFSVLLEDDARPDVFVLAAPVAERFGLTEIDVRVRLRRGRGIVWEGLSAEDADFLIELLAGSGLNARKLPDTDVFRWPLGTMRIRELEFRDGEVYYRTGFREEYIHLDPADVVYMSGTILATPAYRDFVQSESFRDIPAFYRVTDEEDRKELRQAVARRSLRREELRRPDPEEVLGEDEGRSLLRDRTDGVCFLLLKSSPGFLRMDRADLVYRSLGDRNAGNSLDNFRLLIGDLRQALRRAPINPWTEKWLEGEPVHQVMFDSEEEFERYNRWFCTVCVDAAEVHESAWPTVDSEDVQIECDVCGHSHSDSESRCPVCLGILDFKARDEKSRRRRRIYTWVAGLVAVLVILIVAGLVHAHNVENEAISAVRSSRRARIDRFIENHDPESLKILSYYGQWSYGDEVRVWLTWVEKRQFRLPGQEDSEVRRAYWIFHRESGDIEPDSESARMLDAYGLGED